MPETTHRRVARELFLAGFSVNVGSIEPWVTGRLTSILEEEAARRGEAIFAAGDPADFIYFVRAGGIELLGGGPPQSLQGPCVFGLFDALLDRQRTRTAVAATDLTFMRVRTDAWMDLLEDSFALARASVRGMARAVAEIEERVWTSSPLHPIEASPRRVPDERLALIERMAFFLDVPLLRGAGVQTLSDLATISEEVSLSNGDALFLRGERRGRIFVLVDGSVVASREAPRVEWRGARGEIVCGAAALDDAADEWEARATSRVRALVFRVDDWFDLMETHFEMLRATLAALAAERERLTERSA